jgi:multiple sugar transport system substrate-binding protein
MRKRSSRVVALGATLALSSSVLGHAGAVAQEQDLTFMLWAYEGDIGAAYDEFIAAFEEANPGTTVTVEAQPFAQYHDTINVKLAGGDPPDVAWIAYNLAPTYIDAGALLDLRPVLENLEGYEFEDLRPSSLEPWSVGEAIYGIPFTNSTNVMYYNKDVFEAAGLPDPDEMVANGEGYVIGLVHQLHTRVQQLAGGGNNAKTEFGAVGMLDICKGLNLANGFQRNALQ